MDTRNTFDGGGIGTVRPSRGTGGGSGDSRFSEDQVRRARLAFEGLLLALCGYLIGVAGIPPLFDAPGRSTVETSTAVAADGSTINLSGEGGQDSATDPAGPTADANDPGTVDPLPGSGVSVVAGRADWTTGYFQAALFKALLEELGYTVSEPSAEEHSPKDMFPLMAQGQVDFWANTWSPIHTPFIEAELDDGDTVSSRVQTVGNLLPASGLEGIVINASTAADNQITSLAQINDDPNLIALFDPDGNGKANVYGCPDGWGCAEIINETIVFNGWQNIEHIQDDYVTMVTDSIAKVEAGTPTLQYTWSPSGYLTSLRPGDNVQWLNLGGRENVLDGSITPDRDFNDAEPPALGPACTGDPCWLGWAAADIGVAARIEFLDANPSARTLFDIVQLKVLDVALANVKYDTGETSEADVNRHAQEWINENRPEVEQWLAQARAAG